MRAAAKLVTRILSMFAVLTMLVGGALALSPLDGAGVLGWKTYLLGGATSYHATAEAACEAQMQSFSPPSTFLGAETHGTSANCDWTHVLGYSFPAVVFFECASGYTRIPPGQCVLEQGQKDQCTQGNPIGVLTGRKYEYVRDFATADGLLHVDRRYVSSWGNQYFMPAGFLRGGGYGWTFDFGPTMSLRPLFSSEKDVDIFLPEGQHFRYGYSSGSFVPHSTINDDRYRFGVSIDGGVPASWGAVTSSTSFWTVVDYRTGTTYHYRTFVDPATGKYTIAFPEIVTFKNGYVWNLTYGSTGELLEVEDSLGRTLTFTWETGTNRGVANYPSAISRIDLPDGTSLTYDYESTFSDNEPGVQTFDRMLGAQHLVSFSGSGPSNVITSTNYHFEDERFPWLLTGITDARGVRYASFEYDARGRAVSTSHSGAETYTIEYAENSSTSWTRTVTNPLGKEAVYEFGKPNSYWLLNEIEGQASLNCVASDSFYSYDSKYALTQKVDEEGRVTKIIRDGKLLPTKVTEAFGTADARVTDYTWRSDQKLSTKVEPGLTTTYSYDGSARLIGATETDTTTHTLPYSTNGETRSWAYTYTTEGLLESVDGPLAGTGDTVSYTYDADGYLETVTDELGHVTTITAVDGVGHPLEVEDANGIITELTYSPAGYLTGVVVDPTGTNVTTTIGYDEIGQVTSVSRGDGSEFTYEYDAARRLVSVTDALGSKVEYTHDNMGGITQTDIENSASTLLYRQSATFDELGRLLTTIDVGSATWTNEYDKVSNLVAQTDPRSGESSFAYNRLNELISQTDQASNQVAMTRNGQGEIQTYTDPRSIQTAYVRNGWGEIIREISPDAGTLVYYRNKLGQITSRTDGRGIVTDFAYDVAGRLTSTTYPASTGENATFTYDSMSGGNLGKGQLTSYADANGNTDRVYNSLGLLASETNTATGSAKTTEYEYDAAGNLKHMFYPSGRIVSFWRDAYGEINSVSTRKTLSDPLVELANEIDWLPFDQRIKNIDFGNGLNAWRTYDTGYRANQISLWDGSTPIIEHYNGYQDNLNLTNIWDNLNSANDESYWYASNNMLQNADGPWGEDTFYRDGVGNLTWKITDDGTTTISDQLGYATTSNRLETITRAGTIIRSFAYDNSGNILTDVTSAATKSYSYNNANRLSSVAIGGTTVGTYQYNPWGQLVVRTTSSVLPAGTTVYFYNQGGHVIAEHDGLTGAVLREYVWLGDLPLAVIEPGTTPTVYYIHTDHLNRPVAMTDASKAVVSNTVWRAFGEVYSHSGAADLDLRFPGQMYQFENGLNYNWNRHYDPTTARYTQPDPLGLVDGPSRYAYVANDPLQKVDPSGTTANVLYMLRWLLFPPQSPPGGGGGGFCTSTGDDEEHCYRQHTIDEDQCFKNYSYNQNDLRGCLQRAETNLRLCLRGFPGVPTWKDRDVDGWQPPKRPNK